MSYIEAGSIVGMSKQDIDILNASCPWVLIVADKPPTLATGMRASAETHSQKKVGRKRADRPPSSQN